MARGSIDAWIQCCLNHKLSLTKWRGGALARWRAVSEKYFLEKTQKLS